MFHFAPQQRQVLSLKDATAAELSSDNHLEALIVGPLVIPFVDFKEAVKRIEENFAWAHEPDLTKWTDHGNEIISLKKGKEIVLAEVKYDPEKNKIFPPN